MSPVKNPKRLRHPIREYLLDRNARRDTKDVVSVFPELSSLSASMLEHTRQLQVSHHDYVTDISAANMAASLESSALLCSLLDQGKQSRVVDLGSGYSSYAIRQHVSNAEQPVSVYSVDDSPEWLEKTRGYLSAMQCDTNNLFSWNDHAELDSMQFDLIFHDMGNMQLRESALPWVFDHLEQDGLVVLDDMHKVKYREAALAYMKLHNIRFWSLREFTADKFGRFAFLASKV